MPLFPQLDINCPTCLKFKTNMTIPSPGGACKTKNSTLVGRNDVRASINDNHDNTHLPTKALPSSTTLINNDKSNAKALSINSDNNNTNSSHGTKLTCRTVLIDNKSQSLLKQRLQIHLPLKCDEMMYPPGALLCIDFVFHDIESFRGYKTVLDVMCLSTRCPLHF